MLGPQWNSRGGMFGESCCLPPVHWGSRGSPMEEVLLELTTQVGLMWTCGVGKGCPGKVSPCPASGLHLLWQWHGGAISGSQVDNLSLFPWPGGAMSWFSLARLPTSFPSPRLQAL